MLCRTAKYQYFDPPKKHVQANELLRLKNIEHDSTFDVIYIMHSPQILSFTPKDHISGSFLGAFIANHTASQMLSIANSILVKINNQNRTTIT